MKKSNFNFTKIFSGVILIIAFAACSPEQDIKVHGSAAHQDIIRFLVESHGYDPCCFEITEEDVIYKGDIAFSIKDFHSRYLPCEDQVESSELTERKHYRTQYLVKVPQNGVRWIVINVLRSTPSAWVKYVSNAASAWNGLNGKVKFTVQSGSKSIKGGINIVGAYLPTDYIALASVPESNGDPGNVIRINLTGPATSTMQKIHALTHEIGHCIGFYHTDDMVGSLITGVSSSCRNNRDRYSVMQPVVADWAGFSSCDRQAFDALY
jgi:hypothetical protein